MAEALAPRQTPNKKLLALYNEWADGGWGMILTGKFHDLPALRCGATQIKNQGTSTLPKHNLGTQLTLLFHLAETTLRKRGPFGRIGPRRYSAMEHRESSRSTILGGSRPRALTAHKQWRHLQFHWLWATVAMLKESANLFSVFRAK